jgi:hypothetical protein
VVEAIDDVEEGKKPIMTRFRPTPITAITTSMWQRLTITMSMVALRRVIT